MSEHTEEPWALDKEIDGVHAGSMTWVKGGWGLVCKTTNQTRCNFTPEEEVCEANAKRIVECVNALAGVGDVAEFMEHYTEYLSFSCYCASPVDGDRDCDYCKALALFPNPEESKS